MAKSADHPAPDDSTAGKQPKTTPTGEEEPEELHTPWSVSSTAPKSQETDTAGDNVKRAPRLSIAVEVNLESQNCFYSGLTENISEGGLFVATYDLQPVGTKFEVTLTLQDLPPIETRAEVRWIRDNLAASSDHAVGMGMAFTALDDDDRSTIQAFMECRIPLLMDGV